MLCGPFINHCFIERLLGYIVILLFWEKTQMEDDLNGRQPKWKMIKMEDNQNGRYPKWKMTKMEDNQSKDNQNGR